MNTIFLHGIERNAALGIYPEERVTTCPVVIDLDIGMVSEHALDHDDIHETLDYDCVLSNLEQLLIDRRWGLLETMAGDIAVMVLASFPVPWVQVRIIKVGILPGVARTGVSIRRERGR